MAKTPHAIGRAARAAGVLWLLVCGTSCQLTGSAPNLLLIVLDTTRADRVTPETTPFLAELAERSLVFDRALASSPWTLPSFGSLWTGRILSRHNAGITVEFRSRDDVRLAQLDSHVPTLPEWLAEAGYDCAAFLNNPFLHPSTGLSRGFPLYDCVDADNVRLRRADEMVDRFLGWRDRDARSPFFAVLHFFDPHMNYDPPEATRGRFTQDYEGPLEVPIDQLEALRKGTLELDGADRDFIRGTYDEELAFVDAQLRRLYESLDDDTIVLLTADHGEELFDRGGFEHGHTLHQELLHVPMLLTGPGVRPGRVATPVGLVDVAPTFMEAAGLPAQPGLEGVSLWPAAGGKPVPAHPLISEGVLYGDVDRKSILRWPLKLILDKTTDEVRLYDLESDPQETVDRSQELPAETESLRRILDEVVRAAVQQRVAENLATIPPETRERLRALGYIE